jgi:uncharacterized membrane protein YqgA involved in biofilm formation
MIGTILNTVGILLGGIVGVIRSTPLSASTESFWKVTLGAFTVYYGLRLTWISLSGSPAHMLKQVLFAIVALSLGRLTGWMMGLQRISNRLGQKARERINAASEESPKDASEGFKVCAFLFCAAPLGFIGAVEDGVSGYFYPLAVKGVMDGFAAIGMARFFGWSVGIAALPVLALQGTITLACIQWVRPVLEQRQLIEAVNATGGLMIFSVALVILQLKKVSLADYLPSLVYAPLIAWLMK